MSFPILRRGSAAAICAIAISCTQAPATEREASPEGSAPRSESPVVLAVPGTLNRMPSLAVSGGRVSAVWTATENDVMDVYIAVSEDGGATFSEPRRVNDRPGDARSNAEQPPRVVMSETAITVIWPSRPDGISVIRQARSTDGGRTFSPAATLHNSSIRGFRGWQSLALGRDGAVHAVWLDGRHAAPSSGQHHHHATSKDAAGAMSAAAPRQDVYGAVMAADGSVTESHIARDVCFCCKTAVSVGASGRVNVAWRHIFPESMRDIAMTTSTDGGRTFSPLVRVSEDRWQLSGCPDDGPAMVSGKGESVHLAWPSLESEPTPRKAIFYTSTADGRSFAPRVRLSSDDQEDAAHPQIAADAAGNIAAVWDEQHGETRRIVMRISEAGSGGFGRLRILSDGASAFNPHIVGAAEGFLVAWPRREGETSTVVVLRIAAR